MWLRCGPVLSFVIPTAIVAGDAEAAEREMVADITEAAHYLEGLAVSSGQLRRPGG